MGSSAVTHLVMHPLQELYKMKTERGSITAVFNDSLLSVMYVQRHTSATTNITSLVMSCRKNDIFSVPQSMDCIMLQQ